MYRPNFLSNKYRTAKDHIKSNHTLYIEHEEQLTLKWMRCQKL